MARRANAPKLTGKRIEKNGEWVEHKSTLPFVDFIKMQGDSDGDAGDSDTLNDVNVRMVALFITDWSFIGEDGQKLPITPENVRDNAEDSEVLTELFFEILGSDFLERMSRLKKVGS